MISERRNLYAIIFNFAIIVTAIFGVCFSVFLPNAEGIVTGVDSFKYFTVDGNIFCAVAALIALISLIRGSHYSNRVFLLKFSAAVTGMLIFIVAMALVPFMGRSLIYETDMFILHILNPAFCLISFLLFDDRMIELRKREILYTLIPTIIYGIIVIILCVVKVWTGDEIPYPFLDLYNNPIWASIVCMVGIGVLGAAIAFILNKANIYFDTIMDQWD